VSYASEVLADNPKAFWRMSEPSGSPQDSSGNAHHVTSVVGAPTYSQASPIVSDSAARSIYLPDGAYFSVPDHADWDVDVNVLTLEAWLKRDSLSLSSNVISKQANNYAMEVYDTDDKLHLVVAANSEVLITTGTILDLRWHHLVCSYNVTATTYAQWIDGVEMGTRSTTAFFPADANALLIGAETVGGGVKGNCALAEVALYVTGSLFTTARVQAHYNAAALNVRRFSRLSKKRMLARP
jgi:Concanavalin A-like lectin/glucanases superfamily